MAKRSSTPSSAAAAALPAPERQRAWQLGDQLSPQAIELVRQFAIDDVPQAVALGLRLERAARGQATILLDWAPHLVGNVETGVLAGGAITTLLDTVCGASVGSMLREPAPFATLDLRIDYTRPAEPRQTVIASAECYRVTRNVAFTRAIAHQGDPTQPVATATGTFMLSTQASRPEGPRTERKAGKGGRQ